MTIEFNENRKQMIIKYIKLEIIIQIVLLYFRFENLRIGAHFVCIRILNLLLYFRLFQSLKLKRKEF